MSTLEKVSESEGVATVRSPRTSLKELSGLRYSLWWPALFVAALHLATLGATLSSDEGGFAMIARWLGTPGHYLYNSMWVDRPPALIGVFRIATIFGLHGTRVVATVLAVSMVVTLGLTARLLAGRRASAWTGWIACGLAGSTLISAQELNGELIAGSFVSAGILATVFAIQSRRRWWLAAVLAGVAASTALLVKQNFVDGFVFAAVAGLLSLRAGDISGKRLLQLAALALGGTAVPVALAGWWAMTHGGISGLIYAMYGFRIDAARLIDQTAGPAVTARMHNLEMAAVYSGLVPMVLCVLVIGSRHLRRLDWIATALLATFVVEVIGVVGGQNYWLHYLVGVVPTVALAGGLIAGRHATTSTWVLRVLGMVVLGSSVVSSPVSAYGLDTDAGPVAKTSQWLRDSAAPGDSLTTLYSHASINFMSGLRPVYPYSWSLPLRVRDPELRLLAATLEGPHAPTWVLGWDDIHTWSLDLQGNVTRALAADYHPVATVCAHTVWLHNGVSRKLATTPQAGEC